MPKTLYERDMEDSLRQIAAALGVDVSGTPDVEAVIRAAGKAGKDAERYRWLRDNPWPAELALTIALQRNARLDSDIDAAMHTSPTRVDASERLVE